MTSSSTHPAAASISWDPAASRKSVRRRFFALVSLALAGLSVGHLMGVGRLRAPAGRFVQRFGLDSGHPTEMKTMRFEPAGDLAAAVSVEAALTDLARRGKGRDRAEEISQARALALDSLTARPGWAYHRFLLGRLSREGSDAAPGSEAAHAGIVALASAVRSAPGIDAFWSELALAEIQAFPALPPGERAELPAVLRRAFRDPQLVSTAFPDAIEKLGRVQSIALLPLRSAPLAAAAKVLWTTGDPEGAVTLSMKSRNAEREERAEGLRRLEERRQRRDAPGLAAACWSWEFEFPVEAFEDPVGRRQSARVLEIWPLGGEEAWNDGIRSQLVRFFLDAPESEISHAALGRAIDSLAGVPEPVEARVRLRERELEKAERLAARADAAARPDWIPYFLDLARLHASAGRARLAAAALERVPSTARDDCEAQLAGRDVARAIGDLSAADAATRALAPSPEARLDASAGGTFSLCVDPAAGARRVLSVPIESDSPTLVEFGWDGGRLGSLPLLRGAAILRVPLDGLSGRRTLAVKAVLGGPIRFGKAGIEVQPIPTSR
jgi:hypothetical protein